jgi:hypothetical protein
MLFGVVATASVAAGHGAAAQTLAANLVTGARYSGVGKFDVTNDASDKPWPGSAPAVVVSFTVDQAKRALTGFTLSRSSCGFTIPDTIQLVANSRGSERRGTRTLISSTGFKFLSRQTVAGRTGVYYLEGTFPRLGIGQLHIEYGLRGADGSCSLRYSAAVSAPQ